MISIFYSTRKYDDTFHKHLVEQSKYENEIVYFENDGQTSLAKCYNDFLENAKFNVSCLIHDDIILPFGFDEIVLNHFCNTDYGILGVAGTNNVPLSGIWWEQSHLMTGNVYHKKDDKQWLSSYSKKHGRINQTVLVDGCFIAVNKQRLMRGFDEAIGGFHFYDVDFCVSNHLDGVKVGVIHLPQFKHKSIGALSEEFYLKRDLFVEKHKRVLPINLNITPTFEANRIERIDEPIAIIIPTRNNFEVLSRCVTSILRFSGRHKLNIYIADTGSSAATKQRYEVYANHIKVLEYDYYHFAKINNDVVKNHLNGEKYLLFCNDDVEFLNDVVGNMFRTDVSIGTVGARLHFPNGMVQHDGVFINISDHRINVGHRGYKTYHKWEEKNHTVIANTGALLFVSTKNFNRAGRFNENVKECFEDVLLNLELIKLGKKNILCSNAVAIHHESVTRKKNVMKQENERHDLLTHIYPEIKKNAKIYARYFS